MTKNAASGNTSLAQTQQLFLAPFTSMKNSVVITVPLVHWTYTSGLKVSGLVIENFAQYVAHATYPFDKKMVGFRVKFFFQINSNFVIPRLSAKSNICEWGMSLEEAKADSWD